MRTAVAVCVVLAAVVLTTGLCVVLDAPRAASGSPATGGWPVPSTAKVQTASPSRAAPVRIVYARPARLIIPKIGLEAEIEWVGLGADHAMATPSRPDTVAWYKRGSHPGNAGTAVIDGHSGYADGRAAAFDDLHDLGKGDRVYVEDTRGRVATFVVRATSLFSRTANAASVFASTTRRRLNLITCAGAFDVAAGTHAQRLVVFAELVRSAKAATPR